MSCVMVAMLHITTPMSCDMTAVSYVMAAISCRSEVMSIPLYKIVESGDNGGQVIVKERARRGLRDEAIRP